MNTEQNKKRFEELLGRVDRPGIDKLQAYIQSSDFYTAPASTRFHLSVQGGLLQHSLNVYDCLARKKDNPTWRRILEEAGEDSLIITALLHDICKTYFYTTGTKNQKTYDPEKVRAAESWQVKRDNKGSFIWETVETFEVNDLVPYGHGEKSVMMIEQFIKLTGTERFAIRWHMGYTEPKELYVHIGQAIEKYPLILALHEADQEASALLEGKDGNKEPAEAEPENNDIDFEEASPRLEDD